MRKAKRDLPVIAFESQQAWDAWLTSQPAQSKGLWLKLAKKSSGIASVSRTEAVDAALCHGWIDGQLDSFDDKYWLIRFTPRQSTSKWSEKNRSRALQLVAWKRMQAAGLNEIERAKKDGRWDAAYAPQSTAQVPDDLRAALAKNKKAKSFFGNCRRRIETVISQLSERLHIERVRARDKWHLTSRWARKLLAHTTAAWINYLNGAEILEFDALISLN